MFLINNETPLNELPYDTPLVSLPKETTVAWSKGHSINCVLELGIDGLPTLIMDDNSSDHCRSTMRLSQLWRVNKSKQFYGSLLSHKAGALVVTYLKGLDAYKTGTRVSLVLDNQGQISKAVINK